MKVLAIFVLALALTSTQYNFLKTYREEGYDILEHPFGHHHVKIDDEHTKVFNTGETIHNSASLLETHLERKKNIKQEDIDSTLLQCAKKEYSTYFNFLSQNVGIAGQTDETTQLVQLETNQESCFKEIDATFTKISETSYSLSFAGRKHFGKVDCLNVIQFASADTFHFPAFLTLATPKKTFTFEDQTAQEMSYIRSWGIHIFQTCDKITNIPVDILLTAQLFIGGFTDDPNGEGLFNSKPLPEQVQANINFIKNGTSHQWEPRNNTFVNLSDTDVKSGDFLIITRFDGVDNLISWGAGGTVGHTCLLVEIDGVMHVVESQDGWYWPKHGIQRNTWTQWKQWAQNAGFNVAVLPLKDDKRALFQKNIDKALDFFYSVEGLPYGYHNFLFGWLDDTTNNLPPIATFDYIFILFTQLEKVIPKVTTQFMAEALNKRLGTTDLNLPQCAVEAANRGMTINDLFSIPEEDGWVYSDGQSMVCSSFVTAMYKHAGLFEGIEVTATEFTPRDVYQLDFWNTTATRPHICQIADPDLPYCQVMGTHRMNVYYDKWSTVKPYDRMFTRCPSQTPLYERDTSYPYGC